MPYIKTKTSTPITKAQEVSLKEKLGKAITTLGKGEAWLMLEFGCRPLREHDQGRLRHSGGGARH